MKYFEYVEPSDLREACQLLNEYPESKVLAGGASLIVLLKNNLVRPSHLINIKTIPGLNNIQWDNQEGLKIGALNRHCDILFSQLVNKYCPILSKAASKISSPPIRNMGTIGGNLCHGEPAADFPPSLIALGAKLKLISNRGERIVPIEEFFVDFYETILFKDEILVEIIIPPLPPNTSGTYFKLEKTYNSIAVVGVAAIIGIDEKEACSYVGLGLGGVAQTPLKVNNAEKILLGKKVEENLLEQIAIEAQEMANPITNIYASDRYRKEMVYVLTKRALQESFIKALSMVRRGIDEKV